MDFKITYRNDDGEVMTLRYDSINDKVMIKHTDLHMREMILEDSIKKFKYTVEEGYMIKKFVEMSMVMKGYLQSKSKQETKTIVDNI